MNFKAETNFYEGFEKHKITSAIRSDRMRKGLDFDESRTASRMPSQSERRLLLAAAAAQRYVLQSWDIPGAFMRAPNDPRIKVTMIQPLRADETYKNEEILVL